MLTFKHVLPAVAILAGLAGSASAATNVGVLRSFNPATHVITLNDGASYVLDSSVNATVLPVGQAAAVAFQIVGGQRIATDVTPVLPAVGPQQDPSDMPSADQQ